MQEVGNNYTLEDPVPHTRYHRALRTGGRTGSQDISPQYDGVV